MKTNELIITIANALPGVPPGTIAEVLRTAGEVVAEVLNCPEDEEVTVPGFGKFQPRQRLPRLGRNPRTGEEVSIRGKRVVHFAPGKAFRETVAGKR
jgi:nucleoid DNA-binding protein